MAHFVELDENNIVKRCLVVNDNYILQNGIEVEQLGIDHLKSVYGEDTIWKQTSYNDNMRVRFGRVGYTYDEERDAFIPPKPQESFVLDENTLEWVHPIPCPEDGNRYEWDEDNIQWKLLEIQD